MILFDFCSFWLTLKITILIAFWFNLADSVQLLTKNEITMLYLKKWNIASFFTKLCKVEPHKTKGDP